MYAGREPISAGTGPDGRPSTPGQTRELSMKANQHFYVSVSFARQYRSGVTEQQISIVKVMLSADLNPSPGFED
jgi:hypothetical protein